MKVLIINFIIFIFSSMFLLNCCVVRNINCVRNMCVPHDYKTKGSISCKDTDVKMKEYSDIIKKHFKKIKNNKKIYYIGHQAGNYRRYPIMPRDFNLKNTDNINSSMDQCFNSKDEKYKNLDGIEIDLQQDTDGIVTKDKDLYVIHEKFTKDLDDSKKSPLILYLKNNSLKDILYNFIGKEYYKNKFLYIELKCADSDDLTGDENKFLQKIYEDINNLIEHYKNKNSRPLSEKDKNILKGHICFVSFNYKALRTIYYLKNINHPEREVYKLYYIAGTNLFGGRFVTCACPEINFFKDNTLNRPEAGFLYGVWFDPYGIPEFAKLFNNINKKRKEGEKLKFSLSVYKLHQKDFHDNIKENNEYLNSLKQGEDQFSGYIEGLIFDIDP